MNKKDYKGYELIKAISDKEIKDKTKIEVHSLKVLDITIAVIEYSNKRLEWRTGEFDTSYLFNEDYYFRVLEDKTEEIEEVDWKDMGYVIGKIYKEFRNGFEEGYTSKETNCMAD